jgi:hypothetical protein
MRTRQLVFTASIGIIQLFCTIIDPILLTREHYKDTSVLSTTEDYGLSNGGDQIPCLGVKCVCVCTYCSKVWALFQLYKVGESSSVNARMLDINRIFSLLALISMWITISWTVFLSTVAFLHFGMDLHVWYALLTIFCGTVKPQMISKGEWFVNHFILNFPSWRHTLLTCFTAFPSSKVLVWSILVNNIIFKISWYFAADYITTTS